ncbi:MAG: alpha-amylase [Bacteroidales bacterium]|nr:alpha-amylase [Bacteroidales bacterium]MCF8333338.1 alpha-amylase [Bacteroidales bacterium]
MKTTKPYIYQIFTRLFGNKQEKMTFNGSREENGTGKFDDITQKALEMIKELGITHVWYTGIIEHALVQGYPEHGIPDGNPVVIKGKAGSPYAIKDYYDVNPDLAVDVSKRMSEFEALVERTHESGMKVIIDFVPNHLARIYHSDVKPEGVKDFGEDDNAEKAFDPQNNFYYIPGEKLILPEELHQRFPGVLYEEFPAKATGNDQFTHQPGINDWYETVKLNYGVDYENDHQKHFDPIPDTWKKMEHILKYWAGKGVDGFRCDMAEMVPVEFWEWVIQQVKADNPEIIFIAEIYNPDAYSEYIRRGGFDYLYDKVDLYDTLKGVMRGEQPASEITGCWQSLQGNDACMLRFLENHDEQRIASRFFAGDPWKAIPAMLVSATINKGPAMLYFGQEVGEPAEGASGFSGDDGRTTIFDYWRVPEHQKWMNNGNFDGGKLSNDQQALREKYREIGEIAQEEAIVNGHFYDLMYFNEDSPQFDSKKIYAYIRYTGNQKLLFLANFSGEEKQIRVKIPKHAFEMMGMKDVSEITFKKPGDDEFHANLGVEKVVESGVEIEAERNDYKILRINS